MKNKMVFIGIIVFIFLLINSMNVYAISFNLEITGEKTVEVDKTIKLKAEYWLGNDMWIPNKPNGGLGEVSREDVTNESSWTSSNNNIAVVDNKGKVTGVSEGTVTITAQCEVRSELYRDATYEITVKPKELQKIEKNTIIIIIGILSIMVISIALFKKYKDIK